MALCYGEGSPDFLEHCTLGTRTLPVSTYTELCNSVGVIRWTFWTAVRSGHVQRRSAVKW